MTAPAGYSDSSVISETLAGAACLYPVPRASVAALLLAGVVLGAAGDALLRAPGPPALNLSLWVALALGALRAWTAAALALVDATRPTSRGGTGRAARWRSAAAVARGLVIATPLLAVFGALFMSADAVFEELVANAVRFDFERIASHSLLFSILAWLSTGYLRGFLMPDEIRILQESRQ